jgi:hypothetical protein
MRLSSANPWLKRQNDRTARFGWGAVRAATAYEAFDDIVAKSEPDFTSVKNGVLAKMVSDDIIHLFQLSLLKGASYGFSWGVSLSFVPHDWGEKPKFHRTLKSARMDLWEEPCEFPVTESDSTDVGGYLVDVMHGDECMKNDLRAAWTKIRLPIHSFFDSMTTIEGVLKKAEEHSFREWRGPQHGPDPGYVRAFALARLGRLAEAETVVNEVVRARNNDESPQGLLAALKQISH